MAKEKISAENYYRASFLARTFYKLRLALREWIENFRIPFGKIIGVIIIGLLFLGIYLIVKFNAIEIPVRPPYNKEGFVAAIDKYKDNALGTKVYENDFISLLLTKQQHFTITNKANGQVGASSIHRQSEGNVESPKHGILSKLYYKSAGTLPAWQFRLRLRKKFNNENKVP